MISPAVVSPFLVNDFHFRSLHEEIQPLVLAVAPGWFTDMYIRLESGDLRTTVGFIETTLKELAPDFPLEYSFLNEDIDRLYKEESRIGSLVRGGALLAIFIAGLGINIGVIFFFGAFRHHVAASYEPHHTRYVAYLVKDMGDPPDHDRARRIAADTSMVIAYESPDSQWSTGQRPFRIEDHEFHTWHQTDEFRVGGRRGKFFVQVKQESVFLQ